MFAGERRLSITEHSLMMMMRGFSDGEVRIFVMTMVVISGSKSSIHFALVCDS